MVGFGVLGGGVCVVSVGDGGGGGHEGCVTSSWLCLSSVCMRVCGDLSV